MMNSYRQNKSRNGRVLAATALVIFLFILDILTGGFLRHTLRSTTVVISQWSGRVGAGITGSGIFSTRTSLEAQNRSLAEKLAQFEERAGGYEALREENEQLRALVRLVDNFPLSAQGVTAAVVSEIFAPGSTVEAVVGGAPISAVGSGGGNARAKVPRALSFTINQPVTAPELGQRAIGIVGSIASSSASASQDVFIVLPVNLGSLKYVYILPVR